MHLKPILAFAFLAGCATAPALDDFDNRATISSPEKTLAFVGEKIAVSQLLEEKPENTDPNRIVISLDIGYVARYRVLHVVHGEYNKEFIDFIAYSHYGFPKFAKRDVALIYLTEYEGALYHQKYQYDAVYPTADARYAGCGDPYFNLENATEIDRRSLQEIEFHPPVRMKLSDYLIAPRDGKNYSVEEIEENRAWVKAYFAPPVFDVRGDIATCKMGVFPEELYRIWNETISLPNRREGLCAEKLNLAANRLYAAGSPEGRAMNACVTDLKARGLP